MDMDLSPKTASQKIFEGEGGSYHGWSGSDFPLLGEAKVGAGKLVLKPNGFALPHYADTAKVGYVLQGAGGVAGMVIPGSSKEVVLGLKKGDVIPVPLGAISWWYNGGVTELVIVLIGNTSTSYVPGEISYFLLTGGLGILSGFSSEIIRRSYCLDDKQATDLTKSQAGVLIIKLEPGKIRPQPSKEFSNEMVYNIVSATPDVEVERGGVAKSLTGDEFSFLGEAGLSVNYVSILANATESPKYAADGAVQVVYVARGSGKVEIVGKNGKRVLDAKVEAGQLFVVPRFFVVAKTAAEEGLECFSILTSPRLMVEELGGMKSFWNNISPEVLLVALDVNPDLEALFKSNIRKTTTIVPPSIGT